MRKRLPIVLGIILVFITLWLLITPNRGISNLVERLDNISYDVQLTTRVFTEKFKPESPVAIIDIDEKSLKAEGHWPWPRKKVAELIDQLNKQGATVIALDIIFPEKEDNIAEVVTGELQKRNIDTQTISVINKNKMLFDGDSVFAKSLLNSQAVLSTVFTPDSENINTLPEPVLRLSNEEKNQLQIFNRTGYIASISLLQQAAKYTGFINIFHDNDGVIRRAPLIMEYHGGIYPALSLQAVMLFLGESISLNTQEYNGSPRLEGIKLGSNIIPTDEKRTSLNSIYRSKLYFSLLFCD